MESDEKCVEGDSIGYKKVVSWMMKTLKKYGIVILDIILKEAIGPFEYCETMRALIDLETLQETLWGLRCHHEFTGQSTTTWSPGQDHTLRIGLKEFVQPQYFVTKEGDNVNLCTMEPREVGWFSVGHYGSSNEPSITKANWVLLSWNPWKYGFLRE